MAYKYGLYWDRICRSWRVYPVKSLKMLGIKFETGKKSDLIKKGIELNRYPADGVCWGYDAGHPVLRRCK